LLEIDTNIDRNLLILKQFIDFEINVIEHFLEQTLKSQNKTLRDIDLSFIWEGDNWNILIDRVISFLFNQSKYNIFDTVSIIKNLLLGPKEEVTIERRDSWLRGKISLWSFDEENIRLLFYAIASFNKENKVKYLVHLLESNDSIDLFSKIPFFPPVESWSGSEVPVLEEKIELLKLIDKSLTGIKLLRHKRWIQENIEGYKERIKKVKIKEYMEDY
ncbi:hypothetical protein V7188_19010, partial [Bacillus pumilus]